MSVMSNFYNKKVLYNINTLFDESIIEQLKKIDKNLTKVENNNIKANWMINSKSLRDIWLKKIGGRSTWGMIKSLFTKPTLVKDPVEPEKTDKEDQEVEEGQVQFFESKDRLDEILRVVREIRVIMINF